MAKGFDMSVDNISDKNVNDNLSYGNIFRELGQSTRELVRNELTLVTTELRQASKNLVDHSTQAAIFAGLLMISVFPFLAFLVIGLGDLLDGRYWLSSLIIAVVCAAIGGPLAYRAFRKIKDRDLGLPYTMETLDQGAHVVQRKLEEIKHAAKGDRHETNHVH
jgi:hypothetical protein